MGSFLIEAAFGSEALIRGNGVRLRMLSIVSKNQNKLRKCCIKVLP